MPPNDPRDNQIDINLSLLPGESETAVRSLIEAMQSVTTQLAAVATSNEDAAREMARVAFAQTHLPTHGVAPSASRAGVREATTAEQITEVLRDTQQQQVNRETQRSAREVEVERVFQQRLAEAQLQSATLAQSARYIRTGQTTRDPIFFGRHDVHADIEREREAFSATQPSEYGRVRQFINRVAQVSAPGANVVNRQELWSQASREVAERYGSDPGIDIDSGERSENASVPPNAPPEMVSSSSNTPAIPPMPTGPAWRAHFNPEDLQRGFDMPQAFGGEWTIQHSLQHAARFLGGVAQSRYTAAGGTDPNAGFLTGNAAALMSRMSNLAPIMANFNHNLMRRGLDYGNLEQLGVAAGAETGGVINLPTPWGDIPIQDPIQRGRAAALGAGLRASFGMQGMAESPYLGFQTAGDIGAAMTMQGFDRESIDEAIEAAGQIRGDVIRNLDPEIYIQMLQQHLREGATALNEFTGSMSMMQAAARSSRQSLDDTVTAANQYAEAVQAQGGLYSEGLRRAAEYSIITGRPSQVGATLMENGLVQGMTFANTGVLPQIQGLLPEGAAVEGQMDAIEQMIGLFRPGLERQRVETPHGSYVIGRNRQAMAMAGQMLGIPTGTIEAMFRQRDFNQGAQGAMLDLDAYIQDYRHDPERADRGRGRNSVGLRDIFTDLRRIGVDRDEIDELRDDPEMRGDRLRAAVSDLIEERRAEAYGKADDPNRSINQQATIDLSERANRFFDIFFDDQPFNRFTNERDRGGNVPRPGRPPNRIPEVNSIRNSVRRAAGLSQIANPPSFFGP